MKVRIIKYVLILGVVSGCYNENPVTTTVTNERGDAEAEAVLAYRSGRDITEMDCGDTSIQNTGDGASEICSTVTSEDGSIKEVTTFASDYAMSPSYAYESADLIYVSAESIRDYEGGSDENQASAGLLTAGEWHDHDHWSEFRDFLQEYPEYYKRWSLEVQNRVRIKVVNEDGAPVPCADVVVERHTPDQIGKSTLFRGKTLADGSVAYFPYHDDISDPGRIRVSVVKGERRVRTCFRPVRDNDQVWKITMSNACREPSPVVDIAFVVDVTGSMGDELRYLQAELLDITDKIFNSNIQNLRISLLFYRDRGDDFVTKQWDFSSDYNRVSENLNTMKASGGGDFPESVNLALKKTVNTMSWSESDAVKLAFLIADAPPHYYGDEEYIYRHAAGDAVKKGIKIIPVAGSGIDKKTEYLFRSIAVKTSGRYIYLTDDSGIGGSHISPDISDPSVESLNEILVRTIHEEIQAWE